MADKKEELDSLDLLIVGAGPAGIATAVEARRAGIQRVLLLEKGPSHSFSIEKLYTPGKRVDKVYLGQDLECSGAVCIIDGTRETVLETMEAFIQEYELPVRNGVEVASIQQLEMGGFEVTSGQGEAWQSRTVVIAIGVFGRPNKPGYPIPPSLKGHIHFDMTQPPTAGESVLIVGGGNTALEYAEFLYSDHPITLAYRGKSFDKANEINRTILEALAARGQVAVLREADIASIRDRPTNPRVEVSFRDGRVIPFHHVVFAIGGSTPEGFLKMAGIEVENRIPSVDHRFESQVPGLFLAGDLVAAGRGTLVKAFNTGHQVVWEGLCQDHLECRIPGAGV